MIKFCCTKYSHKFILAALRENVIAQILYSLFYSSLRPFTSSDVIRYAHGVCAAGLSFSMSRPRLIREPTKPLKRSRNRIDSKNAGNETNCKVPLWEDRKQ